MTSVRTITVTGGFSSAVIVDVADRMKQLAGATFRAALVPVGQDDPPPVDSPTWKDATATQTAAAAVVSFPVDGTTATGNYNVAIDVVGGGRHENVWITDRRDKRVLVVVT
jgi:hypothetical protein